ncbi:alpha/beta hydrolase [Enemella evansiae]|uniref:alpha/beta hydrolase n=1 Tax=Enemella evansiae TaxID=2016499 RepID=UPI000B973C56|nr:alpha/beta hydrolase [Enemella evansiae]OYN99831.1 arylesterase [Enemella evansiae]OYO19136.1 arylesterase [Enemella evansiae]TDO91739.1 acetyl esterase/lipase [Enemella evansiae]
MKLSRAGRWAAAGAAAWLVNRRRQVEEVPRELRAPQLYLPLDLPHPLVAEALQRIPIRVPDPEGVEVTRRRVTSPEAFGADVLIYRAWPQAAETGAAVLWIHGGGHVMGSAAIDHELCAWLSRELRLPVVSVDYRLAPRHPFPADLDDCFAALRWLQENAAELGVDPERIAVAGASAGGGLAAALVQRTHDAGHPVCFQALVYPMLDDRTTQIRDHGNRGRFGWTQTSNRVAWQAYLGHPLDEGEDRPYAAPARREDLSGLPPAWIGVGDLDLFLPEDEAYAARLREAGVPCQLDIEPGMYHAADVFRPEAESMQVFRGKMMDALRRALRITA